MMTNLPRWVALHKSYYTRFSEGIYQEWEQVLCRELGADGDMLLLAVKELIRSCFKGYTEDHFRWLQQYVVDHAPPCTMCANAGLVTVPNRSKTLDCNEIKVLCVCPRGNRKAVNMPDKATLAQYEVKYGTEWRVPKAAPEHTFTPCLAGRSMREAFDAIRARVGNERRPASATNAVHGDRGAGGAVGRGASAGSGSGVGSTMDGAAA
jgi:hypothetical protein